MFSPSNQSEGNSLYTSKEYFWPVNIWVKNSTNIKYRIFLNKHHIKGKKVYKCCSQNNKAQEHQNYQNHRVQRSYLWHGLIAVNITVDSENPLCFKVQTRMKFELDRSKHHAIKLQPSTILLIVKLEWMLPKQRCIQKAKLFKQGTMYREEKDYRNESIQTETGFR